MVTVIIPAKTVVQINGVPVALAVDTIVETAFENMSMLTGYQYAFLLDRPGDQPVVTATEAAP